MVPITRSTNGFCQGDRVAARTSAMPMACTLRRNFGARDAVAIAQQVAGRRIIGEHLDDLSRGPGGGWGICHIEKQDSAAWMQQDDEHVEHTESRRRHHEEVDRGEIGDVVLKEGSPSLRRRLRVTRDETGNSPLRDVEPELEQLAVDARRAPERIGERHGANEFRKLRSDARSTRSPAPGLPGPERTEALSMPANHRLGANDVERLAPPCPTPREPDPEGAVQRPESWSLRPAAEQGELLSERQVLKRQIPVGADCGAQSAQ